MPRRGIVLVSILVALAAAQIAHTDSPTTTVPGDSRPSIVYRPANLPMTTRAPLVVLLHGSGSTPESLITRWSRFNRLADSRGFVVASLSSGTSTNWLAAEWMNSEADVDYMRSELKLLETAENIDPTRVFVVGFSAGGSMAYRAACELADQIAGIGVVSSSFAMTHCTPKQPVSVMGIFGTADGVVKFNGTSRVEAPSASMARWRGFDSCPTAPTMSGSGVVTTQIWQPCAAGTAVAYTVIEGGKHAWSGEPGLPPSSPNAPARRNRGAVGVPLGPSDAGSLGSTPVYRCIQVCRAPSRRQGQDRSRRRREDQRGDARHPYPDEVGPRRGLAKPAPRPHPGACRSSCISSARSQPAATSSSSRSSTTRA